MTGPLEWLRRRRERRRLDAYLEHGERRPVASAGRDPELRGTSPFETELQARYRKDQRFPARAGNVPADSTGAVLSGKPPRDQGLPSVGRDVGVEQSD